LEALIIIQNVDDGASTGHRRDHLPCLLKVRRDLPCFSIQQEKEPMCSHTGNLFIHQGHAIHMTFASMNFAPVRLASAPICLNDVPIASGQPGTTRPGENARVDGPFCFPFDDAPGFGAADIINSPAVHAEYSNRLTVFGASKSEWRRNASIEYKEVCREAQCGRARASECPDPEWQAPGAEVDQGPHLVEGRCW
jgi:hypothetical protein